MPNSTSGIVSVEMQLTATAAPAQIIFIGEFRNQIKIGFKNTRKKDVGFLVIYIYNGFSSKCTITTCSSLCVNQVHVLFVK